MRITRVEAAVAHTGKLEQKKLCTIGIAHKWGEHNSGFYCIYVYENIYVYYIYIQAFIQLSRS